MLYNIPKTTYHRLNSKLWFLFPILSVLVCCQRNTKNNSNNVDGHSPEKNTIEFSISDKKDLLIGTLAKLDDIQLPIYITTDTFLNHTDNEIKNWDLLAPDNSSSVGETRVFALNKFISTGLDTCIIYLKIFKYDPDDIEESPNYNVMLVQYKNGLANDYINLSVDGQYEHQNAYINKKQEITTIYRSENEGINISYHILAFKNHEIKGIESKDEEFYPADQEQYIKSEEYMAQIISDLKSRGNYID